MKENTKFPGLRSVYQQIASIQATSTASERLFSKAGYQLWDRRSRISSGKVEQIVFLYENEPENKESIGDW